jgi:hypothetical protein
MIQLIVNIFSGKGALAKSLQKLEDVNHNNLQLKKQYQEEAEYSAKLLLQLNEVERYPMQVCSELAKSCYQKCRVIEVSAIKLKVQ